jgi:hypothetical protein
MKAQIICFFTVKILRNLFKIADKCDSFEALIILIGTNTQIYKHSPAFIFLSIHDCLRASVYIYLF